MTLNSKAKLAYPNGVNILKTDVINLFNDFENIDNLKASDAYSDNTILKLQSGQRYKVAGAASDAGITDADIIGTNNKFYDLQKRSAASIQYYVDTLGGGDTFTLDGVSYTLDTASTGLNSAAYEFSIDGVKYKNSVFFENAQDVLSDTRTHYPDGTELITKADGFSYEVVSTGENTTTSGGVKLKVISGLPSTKVFATVGNGTTGDAQRIVNHVLNFSETHLPSGTYNMGDTDLSVLKNGSVFSGAGYGQTILEFNDAGLIMDGVAAADYVSGQVISGMTVRRAAGTGYAFHVKSSAADPHDAIRWRLDNLIIEGNPFGGAVSPAKGVFFDNSYLGTITDMYVHRFQLGVETSASNAISWLGGEIQNNAKAGLIAGGYSFQFYGTSIEGNVQGVEVVNAAYNTAFNNCSFEANGLGQQDNYDIKLGGDTGVQVINALIQGCQFQVPQGNRDHSIVWKHATGAIVGGGNTYFGYDDTPHSTTGVRTVDNSKVGDERYLGSVSGSAWVDTANAGIVRDVVQKLTVSLDFPNLSSGSTTVRTHSAGNTNFAFPVGTSILVTPVVHSTWTDGVNLTGYVETDGTISVRATNFTSGNLADPSAADFNIVAYSA
tara:strand:- start:621 stop:2447 length:1827 start_codon:yes stop_codon:yes gene_type:complete